MVESQLDNSPSTSMASIQKLDAPQNLTVLAYDSIKRYILEGNLDQDTRLTEEYLSSQLGISKSPVREALISLQTEGLIRIEPRRGTFLRRFTLQEVKDLYDLRETLEVYAVSIAEISPQLLAELRESVERTREFVRSGDKIGHIEEDMKFHGLIAQAGGNSELCRLLANIQNQIWLCRCKTYSLSSSTAAAAHLTIVDAVCANDRQAAQECMREHISLVRNRLMNYMAEKALGEAFEG
ncbi:MAG TPA: GntR family transcriptional regulator [Acidobacteriaceae bacterium]|nr:GntR family transcriptional regulator [Acidobacteriaceae bacterium]